MKRMLRGALIVALIAALAMALAAAGFAEAAGLEGYVEQTRENGDICVSFGEVEVTLPASWADRIDIFPHDTYALFCHRESCRLWAENTGYTESGVLFSLNVSPTTGYTNLPSYMDIGEGERGYYFLAFPTDYQAYAQDEAARAEFDAMLGDMDFVKANAHMVEDAAEAVEAAAPALVPMPVESESLPESESGAVEAAAAESAPALVPMPAESEPISESEPRAVEAAAAESEPALLPMPAESEPLPESEPEVVEAAAAESEPALVPMPAESEPVPEPGAVEAVAAESEPALVPMPEATVTEPGQALEPMPEAEAEPEPVIEPMPEAEPEPVPEAEPAPAPEAAPEAVEEPEPAAGPAAEPVPEPADDGVRSIVYDASTAPFDGVWVTFDDGFQLLLPGEWLSYEITEEQSAAGLFFRAGNDGSDSVVGDIPMGVAVSYVEAGGLVTLDDLVRDFESAGFTNLEKLDLNGVPSVFFVKPEEDYCGVAFFHAVYPEYIMAIYATPIGDAGDAVSAVNDAILSSLKPYTPQE